MFIKRSPGERSLYDAAAAVYRFTVGSANHGVAYAEGVGIPGGSADGAGGCVPASRKPVAAAEIASKGPVNSGTQAMRRQVKRTALTRPAAEGPRVTGSTPGTCPTST